MLTLPRTLLLIALVALFAPPDASAAPAWPANCHTGSLPSGDTRYPADQLVLVCLPVVWNGQLMVYAHGFVPVQEPLALPADELTLPDGRTVPEIALALGFAFVTTSYHKNGYAVEQAGNDLNALVDFFRGAIAPPRRVYLVGASEGGLVTTMLIERSPERYDGGLALCGPLGGAVAQADYVGDFRAVFDYFFPDVFPFGVVSVPSDAYLRWNDLFAPSAIINLLTAPAKADQLFRVTDAARDPANPVTGLITAYSALWYSIWETNDLTQTAGGQPYGNLARWYAGSSNDAALNAGVERVAPDPAALVYLLAFYQPTGELRRPLVTMHTTQDSLVPFSHEAVYRSLVDRAERSGYLTQLPVARFGHCAFNTQELLAAFLILIARAG